MVSKTEFLENIVRFLAPGALMPTREADTRLIESLRKEGVLVDATGHRLDSPEGVILVSCSDGDQFVDIFTHTVDMLSQGGNKIRPHLLTHHGGGMIIDHDCPLYRDFRYDELLMLQIGQARAMKSIDTVALLVHAPCGAAKMANLTVADVLQHVVAAKKRIKEMWTDLRVGCFFHVDYPACATYPNGRKRTYFLSREAFEQWFAVHGIAHTSKGVPSNGADDHQPTRFVGT